MKNKKVKNSIREEDLKIQFPQSYKKIEKV